jgi:diguanylate cyclase (GGDEF)-like protein
MKWKLGSRETVQYRLRTTGGHYVHCESVGVNLLADPSVAGMVVTTRDVTERRQGEDRLVYQATHNPLTGLPNRVLLMHRLQGLVNDPEDADRPVALALMNIDHLKLINSNHGHRAGDDLIVAVAERLKLSQDGAAAVFHLGGDEFAIIYDQVPEPRHAVARSREVARCFDEPFIVQAHARRVRCSMGIAHVTAGDLPVTTRSTTSGAEELLARAETALWKAKAGGGDRIELFDDELRRITLQRLRIEEDLELAIENDQLVLYYQPVVEIATGRLVGFEALLRWNHPVEGLLAPDAFMETAERTNLILPIGIWVLRTACLELAALHAEHPEMGLTMAVNLSMRQLNDPDLFDALDRALADSGVPPANLCLEVTESTVMEDVLAAQHTLGALHGRGVRIAIDDFGTGYSSLAYLKRFPIEVLKVDRTFVAGLITDPEDTVIVDLVIHLAERMGLDVIAEGVETEAHRQELVRMGCRFGQGYLWSRPVPPGQLGARVDGVWGLPAEAGGGLDGASGPVGAGGLSGAGGPGRVDGVPSATVDETRFTDTVATLAHELRNPIHAVRSAVTLLQMELDELREAGGEASEALWHQAGAELDTIVRQTGGMEAIVSSMADLQAIGAGNLPLQTAVWPLDDLVGRVVRDMVRQEAPPIVVGDLPSVRILADPVRIGQILGNVIGNAFRFSPPGAPVLVWGELSEGWVTVHVVDQGPGIPPDQVGRLFRKFARADHTSRGIGIGLYLARGLARSHGGDLRYRRADTGGSDFVLTLPLPEDRFEC